MPVSPIINKFLPLLNFTTYVYSFQARIKKIMQTDEEVGKVAAPVPVIIYILFNLNHKINIRIVKRLELLSIFSFTLLIVHLVHWSCL